MLKRYLVSVGLSVALLLPVVSQAKLKSKMCTEGGKQVTCSYNDIQTVNLKTTWEGRRCFFSFKCFAKATKKTVDDGNCKAPCVPVTPDGCEDGDCQDITSETSSGYETAVTDSAKCTPTNPIFNGYCNNPLVNIKWGAKVPHKYLMKESFDCVGR